MLFLDKCVKTALLEEGQVLVSLDDLGIERDDLNDLFESIYEQARPYIQKYVKKSISSSTSPLVIPDAVEIKRVSIDSYMNQYNRFSADITQTNWDFNPHTREFTTYAAMSYIVEYLSYPECGNLNVTDVLALNQKGKAHIKLPCKPDTKTFVISYNDVDYKITEEDDENFYFTYQNEEDETITVGSLNKKTDKLEIKLDYVETEPNITYSFDTWNYAIEEWDMKAEIFMIWFKAALLSMIGAIKEQAGNIDTASMPFDVNRDGLLARARELYAKLDDLKTTKSTWWEF